MMRAAMLSILAAAATWQANAQPLGRVFYSPAQRAQLAANRLAVAGAAESTAATLASVKLSGVVRGSGGTWFAWVDGHLVSDGASLAGYRLRVGEAGVQLSGNGRELFLRPGEQIDLVSGERAPLIAIRTGSSP